MVKDTYIAQRCYVKRITRRVTDENGGGGPLTETTPEEDLVEPEISGEPRISKHGGNRASGWDVGEAA